MELYKNYLCGSDFVVNTNHKDLLSALSSNRGNKTWLSRVDRLFPFILTVKNLAGKDVGFTDPFSSFLIGKPTPNSHFKIDVVVASERKIKNLI